MQQSTDPAQYDFVVIGAGSAGCAVSAGLANANIGSVCVLEAGPGDAVPQVKIPFGLLYTMGSSRDWRFKSTPQAHAGKRSVNVNRGRMIGGSSSINSMVWFRGRTDDFDNWAQPGWRWRDVEADFQAIEALIQPQRLIDPHPLSDAFGQMFRANQPAAPTPERESAGVFITNTRNGRRWSAADAFLRPALKTGRLQVLRRANVDRIEWQAGVARQVKLTDGRVITARRGVVLSAGSIGSPAILMRSGVGPVAALARLGINVQHDLPGVGRNLHDHPSVGVHHQGKHSGYGLVPSQALQWLCSPARWLLQRRGRLTSNFVEAGAFFRAAPSDATSDDKPDCQIHFMPYMLGYKGRQITLGSGYFADVCLCRPRSRGTLTLASANPQTVPNIDLGLLSDQRDVDLLVAGFKRLRELMAAAPFESMAAPEVYPADRVRADVEIIEHVRSRVATAYHPVGTLAMGDNDAPVTPELQVRGVGNCWVADASVMPRITSANTNAPSMMIGYRAASLIAARVGNTT
jgi:choline dehydrogenase